MIKLKWPEYPWPPNLQLWRPNLWLDNRSSIWTKWTPQEDGKSNNAAQHDEQQTTTLERWNHKKKNLDLCENHLFILKYREKDEEGWFQVKNWRKTSPQWKIWKRKAREKTRVGLLEREGTKNYKVFAPTLITITSSATTGITSVLNFFSYITCYFKI